MLWTTPSRIEDIAKCRGVRFLVGRKMGNREACVYSGSRCGGCVACGMNDGFERNHQAESNTPRSQPVFDGIDHQQT